MRLTRAELDTYKRLLAGTTDIYAKARILKELSARIEQMRKAAIAKARA